MKVLLAGYNVDVATLAGRTRARRCMTPETISAAYARISRSPKPIDVLRAETRRRLSRARASNRRIVFEMGHHSIAEHAVFNFDVMGISRLAVEELEHFRIAAYTEKSQRYVTLAGDHVVPRELTSAPERERFRALIRKQNGAYRRLLEDLKTWQGRKRGPTTTATAMRDLENRAQEDARYVLALATQTQVGMTVNARSLELMLRRFASSPRSEINELGSRLYRAVRRIAPSIIRFATANDFDAMTYPAVQRFARHGEDGGCRGAQPAVRLHACTPEADARILTALLFRSGRQCYRSCRDRVRRMSRNKRREFFMQACARLELYDAVLREFEFASLTYELVLSAACYGQLKRHRLLSLAEQDYDPGLGYTMPPAIQESGQEALFKEVVGLSQAMYEMIEARHRGVGAYALTNAHRRRLLVKLNLRELYHLSRLREDPTAQWDIRSVVAEMTRQARGALPVTGLLLGGKTDYPENYRTLYGRYPRIRSVPQIG